jgi:hypothetical protein
MLGPTINGLVNHPVASNRTLVLTRAVAFLLLGDLYNYPNTQDSDRIWSSLSYVFADIVPEQLDRESKTRLLLSEIRDRLAAYRDARKLRAPNQMLTKPPPAMFPGSPRNEGSSPGPESNFSPLQQHKDYDPISPSGHGAGGQYLGPPGAAGPPGESAAHHDAVSVSSGGANTEELMADIDWVCTLAFVQRGIVANAGNRANGTNCSRRTWMHRDCFTCLMRIRFEVETSY